MMTVRFLTMGALAFAVSLNAGARVAGQQRASDASEKPPTVVKGGTTWYTPARTRWGDPDLQGNFTNKYEQSTPFERPQEFDGRRVEEVKGTELAAVLEKRQRQVLDRPAGVGPFEFRDFLDVTKG